MKLQNVVLPTHSRPGGGQTLRLGSAPPAQFHPDAKGPVRNTLPGANQGQEAGGWRWITALNKSKLLGPDSRGLYKEGWVTVRAEESPVVTIILSSGRTVHKIRTEHPSVKVLSSQSLQRAGHGPSYLNHLSAVGVGGRYFHACSPCEPPGVPVLYTAALRS